MAGVSLSAPGHHPGLPECETFLPPCLPFLMAVAPWTIRDQESFPGADWVSEPGSLLDQLEQEREGTETKGGWKPLPLPPPGGT